MLYKISGTTSEDATIIVIRQDTMEVETTVSGVNGSFEILDISSSKKTVYAQAVDEEMKAYGDVYPIFYAPPYEFVADRGVFVAGTTPGYLNVIDYIDITSAGNAIDFGDIAALRTGVTATSNGTDDRGIFAGGQDSGWDQYNTIQYITISSLGNTSDFGDLSTPMYLMSATSNGTDDRGVFGGGNDGDDSMNIIEYITITSLGNSADFGDMTEAKESAVATSNGTNDRGVFGGGFAGGYSYVIEYLTITSLGNAISFGTLTFNRYGMGACSNAENERAVFAGGNPSSGSYCAYIDYITMTSLGNAASFGNLSVSRRGLAGVSNGTDERGVFGGGYITNDSNVIDYVTITSLGNASDFGDLTVGRVSLGGTSNA